MNQYETANPLTNCKVIGANIAPETYLRDTAERGKPEHVMTRTDLHAIAHCPHRWFAGYKSEDTDSTDWGNILDALISKTFSAKYTEAPAAYPSEGKKKGDPSIDKPWNRNSNYCKDWENDAEKRGFTVLKPDEMVEANRAYSVLVADADISDLIFSSEKQVMVIGEYKDVETGLIVPVKGLLDLVPSITHKLFRKAIADFKTTSTAVPWLWASMVDKYWYDAQAALYLDLYTGATGEDRVDWLHAIQENYPPYETGKRLLSESFIELGRIKYTQALKLYCRCLKSGEWPGYDGGDWMPTQPTERMMENATRVMLPLDQDEAPEESNPRPLEVFS